MEQFCHDKQIRGNLKEAFYHHLMAKYPMLPKDEEVLEKEWQEVLQQAIERCK